jgi:hypothetical protein
MATLALKTFFCCLVVSVAAGSDYQMAADQKTDATLAPRAFTPLPVGSITPKGWLLKQLKLQAEGLSGHLAQFWPDVMTSIWIGGKDDGGLHERVPYWLNGIVPLAFLLKNAQVDLAPVVGIYKAPWGANQTVPICVPGIDMPGSDLATRKNGYHVDGLKQCSDDCRAEEGCRGFVVDTSEQPMKCYLKGKSGPTAKRSGRCYGKNIKQPLIVDLMAQAEKYVSYILSHQGANGWLGPDSPRPGYPGEMYWGPSNVLQALYQYSEGIGDAVKAKRASDAILAHLLEQKRRMGKYPLQSWAAERWIDMALTAEWLLDNVDVGAHRQDLLELIGMLHNQGSDWEQWFEHFTGNAGMHNVNNAQGLKSSAVYYRYNRTATFENYSMVELSKRRMEHLDQQYGLPTGMFNGDELLPKPATRSPSRGSELCGVVEAMFSYNTMFSIHGETSFADRAEQIAYNALPATWASPTGGDMWAHQYLQAVNEISAIKSDPHIWQNDGDMAEVYGLEPNFGCCTANFHQGWPKFANMIMYSTPDGGAAVGLYAPASGLLPGGVKVDIDTQYPFEDAAIITVSTAKTIPVYLRIPGWAAGATVNGSPAANGTMWRGVAGQGDTKFQVDFKPRLRLQQWDHGAVSVHRGALMYSLPIAANYTVFAHHFGSENMSNDYFLTPTSPWQYALDVDPRSLNESLLFVNHGYVPGAAPFNHSNWPSEIRAHLRPLPSWGIYEHSAAETPTSPACAQQSSQCGPSQVHSLVPHGGTDLRIGELPLASFPGIDVQGRRPDREDDATVIQLLV